MQSYEDETYLLSELAREAGRFIFYLVLISGWVYFLLAVGVDK